MRADESYKSGHQFRFSCKTEGINLMQFLTFMTIFSHNTQFSMKYSPVSNFINGEFVPASTSRSLDVVSPIDGNHLSTVPMSTGADLNRAVLAAKVAFPGWSKTPIKERVQVFFRYKFLLEKNMKELAELIQEENGKTYGEAVAGTNSPLMKFETGEYFMLN